MAIIPEDRIEIIKNEGYTIEETIRFVIDVYKDAEIEELKKYKKFHDHVASHNEVINAPYKPGEVICKICNKTFNEIIKDE